MKTIFRLNYQNKWIVLKVIFFFLVMFTTCSLAFAKKSHAIFLDMGTEITQLYVFEYFSEQKLADTIPNLKEFYIKKIKLDFSSIVNEPANLSHQLSPLLDSVKKEFIAKNIIIDQVPFYFFVSAEDMFLHEAQKIQLYEEIKNFIKDNHSFHLQETSTNLNDMIGIYAWLDLNYLGSNFQNRSSKNVSKNTLGVVDMRKESIAVAFETTGEKFSQNEFIIHINKKRYILFRDNFVGLGEDAIRRSMSSYVDEKSCYPKNYHISVDNEGSFDATKCTLVYHEILDKQNLTQSRIPVYESKFVGINGFYKTLTFFSTSQRMSHAGLETKINRICNKTWDELKTEYPNDKYLPYYCAQGIYFTELIYHSYQMGNRQFKILDNIKGNQLNWIRGAALYHLFKD